MSQDPLMIDSIGLRELAEYASSLRHEGGDPAYFVVTADPDHPGHYIIKPTHAHVDPQPDDVVVPVNTAAVAPNRPTVKSVTVTYVDPGSGTERQMTLDGSQYDALFWSEAAVEKFLFPYYASKYQWAAAEWLTAMSMSWYGFVPDVLSAGSAPTEELQPMAMVHYPRSDYAEVADGGVVGPGGDVHVLRVTSAGEPSLAPLSSDRRP